MAEDSDAEEKLVAKAVNAAKRQATYAERADTHGFEDERVRLLRCADEYCGSVGLGVRSGRSFAETWPQAVREGMEQHKLRVLCDRCKRRWLEREADPYWDAFWDDLRRKHDSGREAQNQIFDQCVFRFFARVYREAHGLPAPYPHPVEWLRGDVRPPSVELHAANPPIAPEPDDRNQAPTVWPNRGPHLGTSQNIRPEMQRRIAREIRALRQRDESWSTILDGTHSERASARIDGGLSISENGR